MAVSKPKVLTLHLAQALARVIQRRIAAPARAPPAPPPAISVPIRHCAVERFAPRKASTGFDLTVTHAGATPNRMPVSNETPRAKPSTGSEGIALIGTGSCGKRETESPVCRRTPPRRPRSHPTTQHHAFRQGLPDQHGYACAPSADRTDVCCWRFAAAPSSGWQGWRRR